MLDKLFDIPAETKKTLISSGKKFAQEIGCPIEDVCIRIRYAKDGNPYYELYHNDSSLKKNIKIRNVHLDEII
jgi:hypothetical protein